MNQEKFFYQSSSDALDDYVYSCREGKGERWDWIVLTAANKRQADAFEMQVNRKRDEGWLSMGTHFLVVPDFNGERIGSGGATLNVIRELVERVGISGFLDQKTLVIHSGGDSKRIPQYSACGKLFAPVPRNLPSGGVSTLFDELLILASGIPGRVGKGMMVFPSDTQMLFNPLQLDLLSCDAAGISMKVPVAEGKEHGVFLQSSGLADGRNHNVARFLHKQPEGRLRALGAVDGWGQVNIDSGCIWLGRGVLEAISGLILSEGKIDGEKFRKYVSAQVCLNFYADFVCPLADGGSLEEYLEGEPENGMSERLVDCRREIWGCLHGAFHLSLVKMVPARYIHFGTVREQYDLLVNNMEEYAYLGWCRRVNSTAGEGVALNSFISPEVRFQGKALVENCRIGGGIAIGDGAVLSNLTAQDCVIPPDVVISGLRLSGGGYVCRIYGRDDNLKASGNAHFLGGSIDKLISVAGISKDDVWHGQPASIWNARVFPEKKSMQEALEAALALCRIVRGEASEVEVKEWRSSVRHSLETSFHGADVQSLLEWQEGLRREVRLERFYSAAFSGCELSPEIERLCEGFGGNEVEAVLKEISKRAGEEAFPNNMRLFLAASDICKKHYGKGAGRVGHFEDEAYGTVREVIARETYSRFRLDYRNASIKEGKVAVELPVRVNFCGSPSDAAPYCLEHGGTMVDGALLLKGRRPIRVTVERIGRGIEFASVDQGGFLSCGEISEVQDCGDPFDPFALHKAAVVATGLVPWKGDVGMDDFCRSIGGGFRLITSANVPKGSGLGTSSIIAAAAVKAIHLFLGRETSDEAIYAQVFLAEQLMGTGGGWQDQVGGLTGGVKYFTAEPGEYQRIKVDVLELSPEAMGELNERFTLIFSGQRRLARNVLREEMNQCIRNDKGALEAVSAIQEYCAIMRHYLLKGEITRFAGYVSRQFELVKALDKGASNACIEYIFETIDDLIDGKSICGAGGGGFLQVILKEGVSKDTLRRRIAEEFADCGVEVWDCELI